MKLKQRLYFRYLAIFTMFTCVSTVVFALVAKEMSKENVGMHAHPIQIGIDSSEIHRYASHHVHNDKLTYYTYLPNRINDSMKVMFVMHGTDRNAMDYLVAWRDFADENNFLIVAPSFKEIVQGETFDYQEGNIWNQHHEWNNKEDWAFMTVERIFTELKLNNALAADSFLIFGHSAGAQFVHRMVLFMPESHVEKAFAANAGWYTFPNYKEKFPYGIMNTPINDETLAASFHKKLIILLGEEDKAKDHLRQTENANQQGKTRIARGKKFYGYCSEIAKTNHVYFNWEKILIKHTAHNYILMSKEVQKIMLKL